MKKKRIPGSGKRSRAGRPDMSKSAQADLLRKQPTMSEWLFGGMLSDVFAPEGYNFRASIVKAGYILDFYCDRAGLAIELDGKWHASRRGIDRRRDMHLKNIGIRTMRFPSARVFKDSIGMLKEIGLVLEVSPEPLRLQKALGRVANRLAIPG